MDKVISVKPLENYGSLVFGGVSHREDRENEFLRLFSKVSVRTMARQPHLIPKSQNYLIEIEFADGLRKVIDIRPFIGKGISTALKDEAYFRQVTLEDGGGITWDNGYDFCPNFLRDDVPAVNVVTA